MCRNLFGLALALLFISATSSADANATTQQPVNVLVILTDNQPASILGVYGNPDVRTPHIDALAKEGMRFTNAFAVNTMCSPTRATLMTGLMPSQHGVHNWLDDEQLDQWPKDWSVIAEYRTLPLTLKNRGYNTAMIGKWHLGQPWRASIGFEYWVTFTDGHTLDFWDNTVIDNGKSYAVKNQHIVDFFTNKAVDYLKTRTADEPFYLQLNYDGPYLNPPTNTGPARNRHYESYVGGEFRSFPRVPVNKNILDQLLDPQTPEFLINKHRASILFHNDPETMANVASQNTVVDDGVGKVLAALEAAGLADNTLVIFSSDQGNFYGQHGLWQHGVVTFPSSLYEAAMNIPLIVRHPGNVKAGVTEDRLIGQYDLPTTILDYLGIDDVAFERTPASSFARMLRGKRQRWKNAVFYEQEETRGIRTRKFAYWKHLSKLAPPKLFDMQQDPGQHNNLADDPVLQKVVRKLDAELQAFFAEYSDPKYDLWRGGRAKGSVVRPGLFKRLHGEDWDTLSESLPPFAEPQ